MLQIVTPNLRWLVRMHSYISFEILFIRHTDQHTVSDYSTASFDAGTLRLLFNPPQNTGPEKMNISDLRKLGSPVLYPSLHSPSRSDLIPLYRFCFLSPSFLCTHTFKHICPEIFRLLYTHIESISDIFCVLK